jgi:GT2 family glycosyltransferase
MPRVSVIVPIFNGLSFLRAFFDSLEAALPPGSELILVDDGSTEPVFDAVPDFAATDEVIRLTNDRNLGYSVAVNRGFEAATGDVIVQLNTDLLLDRDCITSMIELIEREKDVGIVGSKLVYPTTGLVQHVGMAFGNYSRAYIYTELPSDHPLCGRTRPLQIVVGATVATTRAALGMLGPLDETYFNHCEDLDHCMRAVELGLRNFICAESVAYHWLSKSGPARFAQVKASEALFWARWGGRHDVDLGSFVDEALDHVLDEAPELEAWPFDILDLSRGANESLVLERLHRRWPETRTRTHRFRQTNNPGDRLWLPLVLPHWVPSQPRPFIYLVDRHRELEDNFSWFEARRDVVEDELVVDLNATALRTSDLPVRP